MTDAEPPRESGTHEPTATVVVRSPGRVPLRLVIGEPVVIGRECDGLLLDDPLMSRRHLEVKVEAGAVVVADLGSTNGTTIDGRPVSGPERVGGGAIVGFGSSTLEVLDRSRVGRFERHAPDLRRTSIDLVADAFASERPDVLEVARNHGTTTIVFSDIEASTARAEELGDYSWTKSNNVPSAKITTLRKAVFFLRLTPDGYRRVLAMKPHTHPARVESLADYFVRLNDHLLGDGEVIEFDESGLRISPD